MTLLPSSLKIALTASALAIIPFGTCIAQSANQDDCGANECISPAFDVGILYQLPVGHYGITELMYAVELGDRDKVNSLVSAGVDLDARNDSGATALLMACAYGQQEVVQLLLDNGADPDIATKRGDTPLASAIQYQHAGIAALLLEHGADPNVYHSADNPRLRKSVLVRAAILGQTRVVQSLLQSGIELDDSGLEALNSALWQRHEDVVALLVEAGIDLNEAAYDAEKYAHMKYGDRVLHTAAQQGLNASVRLLLDYGADINDRGALDRSALFYAVREKHAAVVSLLLDSGAIAVGDDVAAALDSGDETTTLQLMGHVDLTSLETDEIDALIARADALNNAEILDRLFGARDAPGSAKAVSSLLFAKADTDKCELIRWDLSDDSQTVVFADAGKCDQGFFFNSPRSELYVAEGDQIRVFSLNSAQTTPRSVELPTAMIDANLTALKEKLAAWFEGIDSNWVSARVVQVGVLESGELAFVTHSNGPADGTYGYLYALAKNSWRLVRQEDCHRFDACRFDEVLGHALNERPSSMTIWHPEIRRNPYFVDKAESRSVHSEYVGWSGVVTFEIDGRRSLLHYQKDESGHCMGDCVYTNGLQLELPGQSAVSIANYGGNNAIVDRYALVWTQRRSHCELIDLGTGISVLGELQVAGWMH